MSQNTPYPSNSFSSRLTGFRSLEPSERLAQIAAAADLNEQDSRALGGQDVLPMELANGMIENVVGKFELPLGVASNFTVNGED
ncbi:MAG: 3-hydroxy-3-methylglutaryl-CoA reductase, partial [Pseudomonadota bacterium]